MSEEGRPVCALRPVGEVRGGLQRPVLAFRSDELHMDSDGVSRRGSAGLESEIVIYDEYAECLEGIEGFSHVMVLYWSHMVGERGREVKKVHPAGQKDLEMVGVFSTRSPARPNPICVTTVELLGREGNVLKVRGLDAVDASPVIDLKPHLPFYDAPEEARLAEWMLELRRRFEREDRS